jgi:hypothetical protein
MLFLTNRRRLSGIHPGLLRFFLTDVKAGQTPCPPFGWAEKNFKKLKLNNGGLVLRAVARQLPLCINNKLTTQKIHDGPESSTDTIALFWGKIFGGNHNRGA